MRSTKAFVKSGQGRRGSLILGNNFPNFDQGSVFGRILPRLNGELKFFGEFGGGLVSSRGFSSRSLGSSGGLRGGSNISSNNGLIGSSRFSLLANFGSSI
jgi:hypothetical protein